MTDARLDWALRIGALCNTARLADAQGQGAPGDPMELALLAAAEEGGQSRATLADRFPKRRDHAFDPDVKMMATVHDKGGRCADRRGRSRRRF
ncbi:hypothetical protein [Roseovarius salinarum]|uniref:hypothetical protein n=1 Tax=Roseovarius salinarum TaxID=1981892 RepID=UPI000C34B152|nr:hypothetical protein [Roseovarius salinarum]